MTSRDDSPVTDEFAVDWSTAPDWAEFHAFDGPEYAYEINRGRGGWYEEEPWEWVERRGFNAQGQFSRSGYTVLSPNWRNSIRQRPEKKMEPPEWIYPGAECETHGGRQARIYAIDGSAPYPVHGAINRSEGWDENTWTSTGNDVKDCETCDDLIGPWRPWESQIPPAEYFADWVKWVAMIESGDWIAFSKDPGECVPHAGSWNSRGRREHISRCIRMPIISVDQWRTTKIRIRED